MHVGDSTDVVADLIKTPPQGVGVMGDGHVFPSDKVGLAGLFPAEPEADNVTELRPARDT